MSFNYKKVLIFGASSGIGEGMAKKLLGEGSSVIATGRRMDKLEALAGQYEKGKVSPYTFDVTNIEAMPEFAAKITKDHPDLDAIFLNAGIQKGFNFTMPETVDMKTIQEEVNINYISYVAITHAFMPFLLAKTTESALFFITGGLALIPMSRYINYCSCLAAKHAFIMALRGQLRNTKIKVVEIFPPAVETDLHNTQKDFSAGGSPIMPLNEFTEKAYDGMVKGLDQVPVGFYPEMMFEAFENRRMDAFIKSKLGETSYDPTKN